MFAEGRLFFKGEGKRRDVFGYGMYSKRIVSDRAKGCMYLEEGYVW